jgi:glycosyltransferase involved in cell wall biosynthesis
MSSHAVYIVTYRRHAMLKRAIRSVLDQSFRDFRAIVVNDDPTDPVVGEIVRDFNDPRLSLHQPLAKRGAAKNFNLMFDDPEARFVALLEDDNWWENDFLATMTALLEAHPDLDAACCNERVWRENPNGTWTDTGRTIWPAFDTRRHMFSLPDLCGSAKLCNSAMLYRRRPGVDLKTPDDIPVDVTEHFRERQFPAGMALHGRPLVNYAETLSTARGRGALWAQYQTLLIGSVFAALAAEDARRALAATLWSACADPMSPRAVQLVLTGLAVREARALVTHAPGRALLRAAATMVRRASSLPEQMKTPTRLSKHFQFLVAAVKLNGF